MKATRKIAVIGVGLLGGSLALALKKKKGIRLVGWNHRASSRKKASRLLSVAPTFEKAVEKADVILLCSHSGSIAPVLRQLAPRIQSQTLIMDVSSVKVEVVREAGRIPGMAFHFVPCHPMAGKEKSGALNADADLYRGKVVFITPLSKSPRTLIGRATRFWKEVGAVPVVLNSRTHDQSVALTSHLPHLLASALMHHYGALESRNRFLRQAVGSGFRDFTRIAAGNPAMWSDIVEMNASEIRAFLSQYRRHLASLERNLKKGKRRFWLSFFERARALRERIK